MERRESGKAFINTFIKNVEYYLKAVLGIKSFADSFQMFGLFWFGQVFTDICYSLWHAYLFIDILYYLVRYFSRSFSRSSTRFPFYQNFIQFQSHKKFIGIWIHKKSLKFKIFQFPDSFCFVLDVAKKPILVFSEKLLKYRHVVRKLILPISGSNLIPKI